MPASGLPVAFFDVDNTLLHGASLHHLGKGAYRSGLIGRRDIAEAAWKAMRFTAVGENARHVERARARALQLVDGRSAEELTLLAEAVYERYTAPKVWPETLALAREHLAAGHAVWLVTTTPTFLARVIAQRLGLSGALGTDLEVKAGVFTGELGAGVLHGAAKAAAAAALAARLGTDLADCWAYSDSAHDLPLLESVGHAVAVNPDSRLSALANERQWRVLPLNRGSIARERRRIRRQGG